MKQSCVSDFTIEAEYVAASEAVKEVVWLCNFLRDLEVIPNIEHHMVVYCNNIVVRLQIVRNQEAIKEENTLRESFTSSEILWNAKM